MFFYSPSHLIYGDRVITESSDSFMRFDLRLSGSTNDPMTQYPSRVDDRADGLTCHIKLSKCQS